jgi:hypothetical protein
MSRFDPANVDVEHFLDTLGIENITKATQSEFRFSCPFVINHSGGDETPSCYMNMNSGAFFCHGCKEKGTAVDMAAYVLQISPLESVRLLRSAYQPGGINPDARDMIAEVQKILAPESKIVQPELPIELLDEYAMDWEEAARNPGLFPPADYFLIERGFDVFTLTNRKYGWDDHSKRIVFPIFDEKHKLIGFKGRAHWKDARPSTSCSATVPTEAATASLATTRVRSSSGLIVLADWGATRWSARAS